MFLYYLIIAPIEMIVEWVFYFFVKVEVGGVITAVFGVSVVINFLALPLYNIADALQDKERQISRRLEPRLKRIRKAFKGDEQFMMISTYYRQNDYHPLYVLRSSLSILIEIPFFIAAYHFLSHCPMLLGEHFWIFKDLGSPDRMWTLTLGSLSLPINILPIIMTAINVVSAAVYTRGGTVKEKVQIYALAAVFLVLLYESPSGLVIYWILNNLFSLAKNVIQKMKHPAAIMSYLVGAGLLLLSIAFFAFTDKGSPKEKLLVTLLGIFFLALPTLIGLFIKTQFYKTLSNKAAAVTQKSKSDFFIFLFSALGLAILIGFLLPTSVIATSPTEFSFLGKTNSPFSYIHSSFWTFLGMCVFWPLCIWFMFGDKVKHILAVIFPALLVCALCNVYIFKADYGDITPIFFVGDAIKKKPLPIIYSLLSLLVMAAVISLYYINRKFRKQAIFYMTLFAICLGMTSLGLYKSNTIKKEFKEYSESRSKSDAKRSSTITPFYHLSKDKQNVIVLFLDRALGAFIPKIIEEFPKLKKQFSGFIFYPNTLSFGRHTIIGSPPMMGGYEYTPNNMNKRSSELLKDKHNESALIMPKLFLDAGYDVTVTDMPYLDYMWEGFLNVFDKYPEIHADIIMGQQVAQYCLEKKNSSDQNNPNSTIDNICRDKIRFFAMVQCMLPKMRDRFYASAICNLKQSLLSSAFEQAFSHLYYLRDLTDFTNTKNTYTFICNETPHDSAALKVPDYDAVAADDEIITNYTPAYYSDDKLVNNHYQVNVAALLQIAKWLQYLKDNHCYDNTR
ncbi:MAG: YidC/Oxa1 family membrane protein insertase, partial [Spirochaetales bacterium]|nr:YidC/Oxa1 family membrane protein insertase [Spirochaetales bacterium]